MFFVGIAGGSGSGKTTFAKKIVKLIKSNFIAHLNQDSYYLAQAPKELFINNKPNFDHPLAFDWDLLRKQIYDLKKGKKIEVPVYDYVKSRRTSETIKIENVKVLIMDGIYALWDETLRSMMDLKIFLHVDADIRFIRRLHRDVKERGRNIDNIISQYYETVRPMHHQYVESTKQFADIIVGEQTDVAAEVIASKIIQILEKKV
jgi:uridine kinase